MSSKPAQVEAQLAALAGAAERANRPTSLLTVPVILLAVALLYTAWAYRGLSSARSLAVTRQSQAAKIDSLVTEIKTRNKQSVDLATIYPPFPFFGSQVGDEIWRLPERGFREAPAISQSTSARIDNASQINRTDITVKVNNETLDAILTAADATLNREFLKGHAFVSQANLTPLGTGWTASIRFSVYEKK